MVESVYIAGAFEHPTREAPDKSTMQLHADVAAGALEGAGVSKNAINAYFTAGIPEMEHGLTPLVATNYLGLDVAYADATDYGGSSYISHVGHAASAIRDGKCDVALITLAGRPRSRGQATGSGTRKRRTVQDSYERIYGTTNVTIYRMAARRHMAEYRTTSEQLAESARRRLTTPSTTKTPCIATPSRSRTSSIRRSSRTRSTSSIAVSSL